MEEINYLNFPIVRDVELIFFLQNDQWKLIVCDDVKREHNEQCQIHTKFLLSPNQMITTKGTK